MRPAARISPISANRFPASSGGLIRRALRRPWCLTEAGLAPKLQRHSADKRPGLVASDRAALFHPAANARLFWDCKATLLQDRLELDRSDMTSVPRIRAGLGSLRLLMRTY